MANKRIRLTLTRDGERAFSGIADGIARTLDELIRTERVKKKDLAEKAGIDQSVLSRVLDGSRNVEIRTVGAIFGALGYVLDVTPKRIHAPRQNQRNPTDDRHPVTPARPK
jgi:DNA-binding phage protein